MSRNGSGSYALYTPGNPVVTGTTIDPTAFNNTMNDIASALTQSVSADGQTPITGNQPMANHKHTGVLDAAARTEYCSAGQAQDNVFDWLTSVTGTDTITASAPISMSAYAAGQCFRFTSTGANTGAVTLNINSIGAKAITKKGATALAAGDIASGMTVEVIYDGTQFQFVNPVLNAQLTTLAGITAQQATDLASLSPFMGTVLNDADAATARTTLGAARLTSALTGTSPATGDYIHGTDTSASNAEVKFLVSDIVALAAVTTYISPTPTTCSTSLVIAENHGLGATPKIVEMILRCTDAGGDVGYSQNDEIVFASGDASGFSMLSVWKNATQVGISLNGNLRISNKATPGATAITVTKWGVLLRAVS